MDTRIKKLMGSNMDIDLGVSDVKFGDTKCPWNITDGTNEHKCAVKNVSICKFFLRNTIFRQRVVQLSI